MIICKYKYVIHVWITYGYTIPQSGNGMVLNGMEASVRT